jgi:hypothetical protein
MSLATLPIVVATTLGALWPLVKSRQPVSS